MDNKKLEQLLLSVQKPGRYSGGEQGSVYKDKKDKIRWVLCFPDTYEIGMSHLGLKILYSALNSREDVWCERAFAPWVDFEEVSRKHNIPAFAIESRDSLAEFDIIGFSVLYEMCYTNILNMLELSGIPLYSKDRKSLAPIVVAGGAAVCNPEPIADFIDLFIIGEGEEVNLELTDLYKKHKELNSTKEEFLIEAAKIEGIYVPSLYDVTYNENGTIKEYKAKCGAPNKVKKRIVKNLNTSHYPKEFVVPFTEIVHDRAVAEVFRGCIRGCRFCQAGFIYRPVREKSAETVIMQAKELLKNTGYDEMSLLSLSTSDYCEINKLLSGLLDYTEEKRLSLSLPSLRIDNFTDELLDRVKAIRKSGLTFAPEAGTQKLRDSINKNINEEEIMSACSRAFAGGYSTVKLYFMLGLPNETDEDIIGIAELAHKILDLYYQTPNRPKGLQPNITVSVACFVPKPFTPFQFYPQNTENELKRKQELLVSSVKSKKIRVNWHDSETSYLEAVFAKGDRKLSAVIEKAFRMGARLDSWGECFDFNKWLNAFMKSGIDPEFYAYRNISYDEVCPWDVIDIGVNKEYLINENEKAKQALTTRNCREECNNCGATCYKCGICIDKRN